jgi:tRNA1(Val) A37 N6-methylase TrmN6
MLIELYTQAYTKEQRRKLGRFDTPMYVTRRIWERIPVEMLPPNERVVCDLTAGWGSFLIAAHERLSRLDDMKGQSLRPYLYGNDISDSAALLAGLGLLLSTLEDRWHIYNEDALTWSWLASGAQPNIIVGNPPFKGSRKTIGWGGGKRAQLADRFFEHALRHLAPGGYLAMIMPRSFVVAESAPALRGELLRTTEILELWELPNGTFADAGARTVVVFARKRVTGSGPSRTPVVVRTLQRNALKNFEEAPVFTKSRVIADQSVWAKLSEAQNTNLYEYKLILSEQEWEDLRSRCVDACEWVTLFQGCNQGNPKARKRLATDPPPQKVQWLHDADSAMPAPFVLRYETGSEITYPDDLQRPRLKQMNALLGPKVLVTTIGDPSWGPRVKVAIERRGGYAVKDNFWVAVPKLAAAPAGLNLEVVAAILGSVVSNAWLIEHMRSTSLPGSRGLQRIPFPRKISPEFCAALTDAVRRVEAALTQLFSDAELDAGLRDMDNLLREAYGLDSDTWDRLRQAYTWDKNSPPTLDPVQNQSASWRVDGTVGGVDPQAGTITLWLVGFDGPQTLPIDPVVPGWLLRPGVPFRTTISRAARAARQVSDFREFGRFTVMPFVYESEDELLTGLAG